MFHSDLENVTILANNHHEREEKPIIAAKV